jgi:hypothetical protein
MKIGNSRRALTTDMSENGIAKAKDFRRVLESAAVERVTLPSGLVVRLCRPPIFAALRLGREGTELQARITEAQPHEVKPEDITAFSEWLTATLTRLFVEPRFSGTPTAEEIGLGDILVDDLKYIFRWLRGEVFSAVNSEQGTGNSKESVHCSLSTVNCTEDLAPFPGGPRAAFVPGGGGQAEPLPAQPVAGAHRDASVPAGLRRG